MFLGTIKSGGSCIYDLEARLLALILC